MLNCSFTSEDEDYGTDTIHSSPATPPKPREQMAYEMAQEIAAYLDATGDGTYRKNGAPYEKQYGDFSNSTLYAIEKALNELAGDYKPDPKEWHVTITDAGKIIATRMLSGKCKRFALCDVKELELMEPQVQKEYQVQMEHQVQMEYQEQEELMELQELKEH